jgi:hypothetical protein
MRRPGGYAQIVDPEKPVVEIDSFSCGHCNSVVFVQPRQDPSELGGFCRLCYKHVCAGCASTGSCDPFEAKLDRIEGTSRNNRLMVGFRR